MASARPVSGEGTRGPLVFLCALIASACTGANPFYGYEASGIDGRALDGEPGAGGGRGGVGGTDAGGTGGGTGPAPDAGTAGAMGGADSGGGTGAIGGGAGSGGVDGSVDGGPMGGAAAADASADAAGGAPAGGMGGAGGAAGMGGSVSPPPPDAAPPDAPSYPVVGSPPATCGTALANVSGIQAARGIAIDESGFIYFTRESGTQSYIGRLRPGQPIEPSWFQVGNGAQSRTMRVDAMRGVLYLASPGENLLRGIAYRHPEPSSAINQGATAGLHGLAVAADGSVYSSTGDGYVYRSVLDVVGSGRAPASSGPVFPAGQRALGLTFGPMGELYVGSSSGAIRRYQIQGGMMVAGVDHAQIPGPVNDMVVDIQGRLYVASSGGTTGHPLFLVTPDGQVSSTGSAGQLAGLTFGQGSLDCGVVYAADAAGAARAYSAASLGLKGR